MRNEHPEVVNNLECLTFTLVFYKISVRQTQAPLSFFFLPIFCTFFVVVVVEMSKMATQQRTSPPICIYRFQSRARVWLKFVWCKRFSNAKHHRFALKIAPLSSSLATGGCQQCCPSRSEGTDDKKVSRLCFFSLENKWKKKNQKRFLGNRCCNFHPTIVVWF